MTSTLVMIVMTLGLLGADAGHAQFTPPDGSRGGPWGGGRFGGDREGMRARMEALAALNLEGMWGVLSFGIGLPAAQLDSLRAQFQERWDRRASILADTDKESDEGWEGIRDEFKDMRKELDGVIKTTIGDEKFKNYSKVMKEREKLGRSGMGGAMGGGPPGGPGH